ncbi:MAG: hypothetical protein ACTS5F_02095 [Candidatus Hodgkinia cicadicola]
MGTEYECNFRRIERKCFESCEEGWTSKQVNDWIMEVKARKNNETYGKIARKLD